MVFRIRRQLQGIQDLSGGVLGIYLLDDPLEEAVLIENEGAAERPQRGLSVHLLLAPGAERLEHIGSRISQKPEGESVFGPEARVALRAVLAYADYVVTRLGEGSVIVPEGTGLGRAAGGVVLRIEVDDGLFPFADELCRAHRIPVLVDNLEGGHFVSNL